MVILLLLIAISAQLSSDVSFSTKREKSSLISASISGDEIKSWKNGLSAKSSEGRSVGEISITINLDPKKTLSGFFDKATAVFNQLYSLRINEQAIFNAIKLENLNGLAIKATLYFENADFNIKMLNNDAKTINFLIDSKKNDQSKLQRFYLT